MRAVLDHLVERPSITGAAAVIGASSKIVFCWMRDSHAEAQAHVAMPAGSLRMAFLGAQPRL
jgi:hypothetical protein